MCLQIVSLFLCFVSVFTKCFKFVTSLITICSWIPEAHLQMDNVVGYVTQFFNNCGIYKSLSSALFFIQFNKVLVIDLVEMDAVSLFEQNM